MSDLTGTKGGSGVWQRIISEMPEHDVYIEAFWGRGTIAKKKRPAPITIGIDLDPDAISSAARGVTMFQVDSLAWLRGYFHLVPPQNNAAKAPDAESGVPVRDAQSSGEDLDAESGGGVLGNFSRDAAAQSGDLSSLPAAGVATFGGYSASRHLVYLDPPYLGCEHYYRCRADHGELIDLFLSLPCPAMLSGYWSEYYADRLGDTRAIQIDTVNRAGKRCTEWVWMNFDPPRRYHDTRFVGSGRRERERIRRRVNNWSSGLARMAPAERQAVIKACEELR